MSKSLDPRRLRGAQAIQDILCEPGWSVSPESTSDAKAVIDIVKEIYTNSDGRVLEVLDAEMQNGNLYNSIEAWMFRLKQYTSISNNPYPKHILHDKLPQGQTFADEVPSLIQHLSEELKVNISKLNGSEASLELIDEGIRKKGRKKCLNAEVFPALLAYIGEVIRQAVQGCWDVRPTDDPEVWEPWIIDNNGKAYAPFITLYDELYDAPRCCISAAIGALIHCP
jgi:hypothetical protein